MNIIVNLFGKYIVIVDLRTRKTIAVIENDLGIVRYLLKILREYVISNNNGYLQFENKIGETYLHRIILEYYSKFNDKLFTILKNPDYEVNHKNKKKWDNRLDNLEFVTRINNERHKRGLEYETVMTSEEIIQICNKLKENKQYHADMKYLEKASHRNLEHLNNSNLYWSCNKKFYDSLYIRFSNNTKQTQQTTYKPTLSNMLDIFSNIIFMERKNTFFTPENIYLITYNYNIYRTKNILHNNIQLIFKYYNKDKYFREVCNKYKILDHTYLNKYKQNLITYEEYINHNIIIDLFYYLLPSIQEKSFYKNQLYTIIALNALILTYKRYNPFRVLYILKLLERRPVHYYTKSNLPLDKRLKPGFTRPTHNPSGFFIPKYTDELFISSILPLSRKIYGMDLSKITYTIVARNFGFDTADSVYRNISSRLKYKAKKDFITINDTINILLTSSTLQNKLHLFGFITADNIRHELQLLNQERKEKLQPFTEVKDTDTKFITGIIRNVTDIKDTLDKINVEYIRLNPKTINNINKYQIQNGIKYPTPLVPNQTKIVLKNLIVKPHKKKQTK